MIAISVRQPWAWLLIHGGKDVENRTWSTKVRGRVLIHAAKGMTRYEYENARDETMAEFAFVNFPTFEGLARGGVIGSVEIVDCVDHVDSPWFCGPFGFLVRDPQPRPFVPCKGRLGFFDVPDHVLRVTP